MKTLIVLTASEDYLEYIPSVRVNAVRYLGEMNLEDDNSAPANLILFNGKLTVEQKKTLSDQIELNDEQIHIMFLEYDGEPTMPDDYTFVLK